LEGEHEKHQHHRHGEHHGGRVARLDLQQRQFRPLVAHRVRQALGGSRFHQADRVARTHPGQRPAADRRRGVHVVAIQRRRAAGVLHVDERAEREHLAARVPHLKLAHRHRIAAETGVGLQVDLEIAAEQRHVVHVERAEVDLQRVEHLVERHAHRLRLAPVDRHEKLRRTRSLRCEEADEARLLAANGDRGVGRLLQRHRSYIAAVLDLKLEAAGVAQAVDRRRAEDADLGVLDGREPRAELGGDLVGRPAVAFLKTVQNHEHRSQVRAVGVGQERHSLDAQRIGDAFRLLDDLLDLAHHLLGAAERGRVGQLRVDQQVALVLIGNEPARHRGKPKVRQPEQSAVNQQHDQAQAEGASHQVRVPSGREVEKAVEAAEKPAQHQVEQPGQRIAGLSGRLEQQGRQGRAQGQRVEGRDHRRDGDREGKLAEELAGDARNERRRHEHSAEHQGHGDHRAGDLLHRFARRLLGRQPVRKVVLNILDDHDRVIDHDADRQHQAEQGEVVEAESECGHHGKRADERNGYGDERDHRRPPVLQEHEHHDRHEDGRVAERLLHLVNRFGDEGGRVVDDLVLEAFGKPLLEPLHLRADALGGRQGVGARQLEDR